MCVWGGGNLTQSCSYQYFFLPAIFLNMAVAELTLGRVSYLCSLGYSSSITTFHTIKMRLKSPEFYFLLGTLCPLYASPWLVSPCGRMLWKALEGGVAGQQPQQLRGMERQGKEERGWPTSEYPCLQRGPISVPCWPVFSSEKWDNWMRMTRWALHFKTTLESVEGTSG